MNPRRPIASLGLSVCGLWLLLQASPLHAHHFKGLPHYNYFENYPQIPEEEFLGQAGAYELSLVVYDFQGVNRADVQEPEEVRLFLLIFSLRNNGVYNGPVLLELMDGERVVHAEQQPTAQLENTYSLRRKLPDTGRYHLRVTLSGGQHLVCDIPFTLSTQKVHWGQWITGVFATLLTVAAVGARKARVHQDRRAQARRTPEREAVLHDP